MCGKWRNQRRRQNEESRLITDRCLVLQEVLKGAHLKDVSMTQRIFSQNAIMFGASVIFILLTLLPVPVFGYAI